MHFFAVDYAEGHHKVDKTAYIDHIRHGTIGICALVGGEKFKLACDDHCGRYCQRSYHSPESALCKPFLVSVQDKHIQEVEEQHHYNAGDEQLVQKPVELWGDCIKMRHCINLSLIHI